MMLNKTFYLLLLSLIPIFGFSQANSQYPDSGNKIRLGFQTTGDGLIWRDTQPNVGIYQPINNKAAWIILDTMNNKFYHYKNSTWTLAGGQDIDTANLIATKYNLGFKLSLADTQNMLTPYWRSGRFSGVLPVENGGTGSSSFASGNIPFSNGTLLTSDTSLYWNNTNKYLGIGTTNPISNFHLSDGNSINLNLVTTDKLILTYQNIAPGLAGIVAGSAVGNRFVFKGTRSRGTLNSPTVPLENDEVLSFLGAIYDGGNTEGTAQISFVVDGTVGIDTAPQRIGFFTSQFRGVNRLERLTIKSTGNVGIGQTTPTARLQVKSSGVDGNTTALKVDNSGDVNLLTILDNGNVGVGVTNPIYKLEIESNIAGVSTLRLNNNNTGGALMLTKGSTSIMYNGSADSWVGSGTTNDAGLGAYNGGIRFFTNNSTATRLTISTTGLVGIGRTPTTNILEINGDASKTTLGQWLANSDSTIKTEIHTIDGALDRINKIRLVSFKYKNEYKLLNPSIKDKFYQSVIAQEFQKIYPDYVYQSGTIFEGKNILQVDTNPMYIDAIASIQQLSLLAQELQSQIDTLKQEIINLKNK